MKSRNVGALILIVLGVAFLLRNANLLPSLSISWPVVLIVLGLIALYQASNKQRRTDDSSDEVIVEINGTSSLLRGLVAIPAIIIALVVGLIVLGVLGPFFLIFLLFIPLILFIKLGWVFLRLLLPIIFFASPIVLIILVLALLF